MTGRTRHHTPALKPVFQASCGECGWVGQEWSFEAPVREQNQTHQCEATE